MSAKNAAKKNKRVLRSSINDNNYFVDGTADPATIDSTLGAADAVIAALDNEELAAFATKLAGLKAKATVKSAWVVTQQGVIA